MRLGLTTLYGDNMSLILISKNNDSGDEVYSNINTGIDEIMSEELKATKISLTESEREKIIEKRLSKSLSNNSIFLDF